ncbi:hypothetical protein NE237_000184 [Protea cynaroides]|uniref:PAS domain-containing protein n=1 Tax=Protea cynaroides TaxID=273540 RepID=A0A9Q0KQM4_9MAGN|nr:hypothetical protein NE237_000184 [Protea cynaroides]
MESQLALIDQSFNARYSSWVREALDDLPGCFTVTDPCIPGHRSNAKMFQGPETNWKSVMEIREAVREEKTIQMSLLNYRKDGTPFWMLFHLSPVFNMEDGRVIHFVAVQLPIARKLSVFTSGFGRMIVFGSCRKEVCLDSVTQPVSLWAPGSFQNMDNRGWEAEESCEASDQEKQKAATSINNILSVLTHYSELTGKLVCEKRCNLSRTNLLGSSLIVSLGRIKHSFVLTDPHSPDMPIVICYARHEVLGKNCRFLNGHDTDAKVICRRRETIENEQAFTVRILNYRKDGSSFWNHLHISPVRNATGKEKKKRRVKRGENEGCVSGIISLSFISINSFTII